MPTPSRRNQQTQTSRPNKPADPSQPADPTTSRPKTPTPPPQTHAGARHPPLAQHGAQRAQGTRPSATPAKADARHPPPQKQTQDPHRLGCAQTLTAQTEAQCTDARDLPLRRPRIGHISNCPTTILWKMNCHRDVIVSTKRVPIGCKMT